MKRLKTLTLLIVLLLLPGSDLLSQVLAQSQFAVPELRLILKIVEGEYPRLVLENSDQTRRINELELAIINHQKADSVAKKKESNDQIIIANWQKAVDALTPSWWDTLWQNYIKPAVGVFIGYLIGRGL